MFIKFVYILGLTVVILISLQNVTCKIVSGTIETHKNWAFLTRFCFMKNGGQFNFTIIYPVEYATQSILLYHDEPFQWEAVYKNESKSCFDKVSVLSEKSNQLIHLNESYDYSECRKEWKDVADGVKLHYVCSSFREFKTKRERWWYLAVSNCHSTKGLSLKYSLTMINNHSEFLRHFSADQYYIIHTDLIFLCLYICLIMICGVQSYWLIARRLFHTTYKLYLISVVCEIVGIAFLSTYNLLFAIDGSASQAYRITGNAFKAMSSIIFLLLLILLSKGYTVTRARLKSFSAATIAVFITIYFTIYALLFVFENLFFDPGEVLYTYESMFGYGLVVLRFIGLIAFTYFIYKTVRLYPTKKGFFIILYIMYCVWFISIPIVIVLATNAIPKYMREQVVNGFELGVAFRAHVFFMLITWPTKFNKIFPFHVRTNQIMAMSKTGRAGDDTLDKFTHYQYAPKRPQTQQSQIDQQIETALNGSPVVIPPTIVPVSYEYGTQYNDLYNNNVNNQPPVQQLGGYQDRNDRYIGFNVLKALPEVG